MEDILLVHRKTNRNFAPVLEGYALWKTCLRQIMFLSEAEYSVNSEAFEADDHVLRGEKAFSLLLEILCGLHSPIVGETEVFGQFKNFVESRKQISDPLFGDHQKWLNFIFSEVKKTRSEHLVGIGSQSYGSLVRKYSKDANSVTICGSGQLALEILPWVAAKSQIQLICRTPAKMQTFADKYSHLNISNYNQAYIHGEVLVIAAPLEDQRIVELMSRQDTRPLAVCDLRGEDNRLADMIAEQFPHVKYLSLQQFFAEIEETKKDTHNKITTLKNLLFEKAQAFMQRTELRPLGWDDLCA
ncbi:hypothetical protein [Bdellovibrio sp. HCB2-146]|uniref:hypothetical protein n=1 Tax=Bdellovibrio sp. HCB2-146 TaxID=3394362 RepID=UPI0039BD8E5D